MLIRQKRSTRAAVAFALALALVFSMGMTAFASDGDYDNPQYQGTLYKDGQYPSPGGISMGNPSIKGIDYDGTTLTVWVQPMWYLGIEGWVKGIDMDLNGDSYFETKGESLISGGAIIGVALVPDKKYTIEPLKALRAKFNIELQTGTHPILPAIGDLVYNAWPTPPAIAS